MRSFKTLDGVEWKLVVNVLTIRRVEQETGLRLTSMFDRDDAVQKMFADEFRVVDVIVSVVSPQLKERGVSVDDFLAQMDGSTIDEAANALVLEVAGFFQEPRRTMLLESLERARAATARIKTEALNGARQRLAEMDETAIVEAMLSHQIPTSIASSSPESAA